MASNSSTLIVRFLANTTNLQAGTKRAQAQLTTFGKAARAAGVAAAAAFAAKPVVDGIKASIDAFADYTEAVNKTTVLFGEASTEIINFSETAADAFGLSKTEALEAAGTFQIYADAAGATAEEAATMSKQLIQVATDLASISNTSTADALQAIESALAGQSRPLRRYAILADDAAQKQALLNEELYNGVGDLNQQQKVLGTYYAILSQAGFAVDDFRRTQDDLANATKRLQGTFDNVKIAFGRGIVEGFDGLEDGINGAIKGLESLTPLLELFGQSIGRSLSPYAEFVALTGELADKLLEVQKTAALDGVINGLVTVFNPLKPIIDGVNTGLETLNNILPETTSAMSGTVAAAIELGNSMDYAARKISIAAVQAAKVADFTEVAANKFYRDAAVRAKALEEETEDLNEYSGGVRGAVEALRTLEQQRFSIGPLEITFGKLKDLTTKDADSINKRLKAFTDKWSETWTDFERDLDEARSYVDSWQSDLLQGLDLGRSFRLANDAQLRESEALKRLNSVLSDPNASAQSITDAQNNYYEAAANAAVSWQEGFAASLRDADAFYKALGSLKDSGLNETLLRQVAALGPGIGTELATEMIGQQGLIGQLNNDWDKVETAARDLGIGMSDTFQEVGFSNAKAQTDAFIRQVQRDGRKVRREIKDSFETTVRIKYVADTSGLPQFGSSNSVSQGGFSSRSSTSRGRQIVEDIQAYELVSGRSWRV